MILSGWLMDLYEDPLDGVAVWLLADDGRRLRLRQAFPAVMYAAGPEPGLAALQRFLAERFPRLVFRREQRRDVFASSPAVSDGPDDLDGLIPVLAVEAERPGDLRAVLREASRAFPRLDYADADLAISLRYAARTGLFPLARCRLEVDSGGWIQAAEALSTPWDLEHAPIPLRVMQIEPDESLTRLVVSVSSSSSLSTLSLDSPRPFLVGLRALLLQHDPDLILASRGDTWLMPLLLDLSEKYGVALPLNRDPHARIERRKERWYYSYGQLIYRGEQVFLAGRWHIDRHNAMLWEDYDLEGVYELARVTCLPVQTAARVSPGTGISAVQMLTALRLGILVPWQKQQAEMPRAAFDLFSADQGGLVYQPQVGLHRDVVGLDFVSMYPAIMVNYNISPETVGPPAVGDGPPAVGDGPSRAGGRERVPELNLWIDRSHPGLVPQSLAPLLARRVAFKNLLAQTSPDDPRYSFLKKRASALKWLLVTCFGYLGYKNARFGRIEAHQAVTAYGREALLSAKEAAEDAGFEVIQLYVDGMWVKGQGDLAALQDEILRRTGLPVGVEGHYRWVAFLPSRVHSGRAAANRYFGVFADGSLKVRGIEARRHDTPLFIADLQMDLLSILARRSCEDHLDPLKNFSIDFSQALPAKNRLNLSPFLPFSGERGKGDRGSGSSHPVLPPQSGRTGMENPDHAGEAPTLAGVEEALAFLHTRLAALRRGRVRLEDLLVSLKLSREPDEYRANSPAARAARQLLRAGRPPKPGQRVRFIYTLGDPGVWAWGQEDRPPLQSIDVRRYEELAWRAAAAVLSPLAGKDEAALRAPEALRLPLAPAAPGLPRKRPSPGFHSKIQA